ncbi:hypothetical protein [Dyadobacter sp. NIV53]|uniref:hypothetical protein n=1 Tax=Dyadobacter sp. NIV53 TaxID=2861765 RepID=UPI001C88AD74|nr:hypothetical protein [Dyadobacter sp. NIV53]
MDLQYISNENGEKTAIIIPIEDWNTITAKHEDLKELEEKVLKFQPSKRKKPSDFVGIISNQEADEMQEYLKKARSEWNRDF